MDPSASNVFVAKHSDIEYVLQNPALFSSDFLPPEVATVPDDPGEHRPARNTRSTAGCSIRYSVRST